MSTPDRSQVVMAQGIIYDQVEIRIVAKEGMSERAAELLKTHLPDMVGMFIAKSLDYESGDGVFTADHLGAQGQYADMWRKFGKLYKGLWRSEKLAGESVQEILFDFFGHILLSLGYLEHSEHVHIAPSSIPNVRPCICENDSDLDTCPRHGA